MRDDEFNSWLRSGASQLAGSVHPRSPEAVRRRGDRRRHRTMVVSGVLAFAVGAGGGGVAYASLNQAGKGGPPVAAGSTSSPATSHSALSSGAAPAPSAAGGIPDVVAVSSAGSIELLSTSTGLATKVLVPKVDAVGDEVTVSPNGQIVYYAVKSGCSDHVYSVPVTGGTPTEVTTGALPAISPDGTELAFVREPYTAYPYVPIGCASKLAGASPGKDFQVVVRNLTSGSEKVYPAAPATLDLPIPISHLSWSPSGGKLLVSLAPAQDNEPWTLHELNIAADNYYTAASFAATQATAVIPVTGTPNAADSYYPEGVYQPDGNVFVVRECCAGVPVKSTSIKLQQVTPSGTLIRTVAQGFLNRVHSSLDAASGKQLYLSGSTLFVSSNGSTAKQITGGLIAATWLHAT